MLLLNEYKLLHALSIVKIKQLVAVLFTFSNNTRAKLAMLEAMAIHCKEIK